MIWKGFRFALAIISGKFIFNFGIAERLRTLRYPIFTGGGVTENGSSSACFLRKCGAAGTAKDLISEENGRVQREQTGEHTLFFTQKSAKTFESPFYGIRIMRYCVHRESPGTKRKHRRETP